VAQTFVSPEKEAMTCIYKISSKSKPDRVYVGSAKNFNARMSLHKHDLKRNKHHSKKLQRHVNKYGIGDLSFSVLEECSYDTILKREQHYIDTLKPYFNCNPIAGSNQNRKFGSMKAEHKDKIRKALTGKSNWKAGIKLSKKLYKYSIDGHLVCTYKSLIEGIRLEGLRIKTYTEKNKTIGGYVWITEGMSVPDFSRIKQSLSAWRRERMKPVMQVDKSGNIVCVFDGVREAARVTGIDHRSIQSVANKSNVNRKTAGGYCWMYKQVMT
jgi:group I intron endonuclease